MKEPSLCWSEHRLSRDSSLVAWNNTQLPTPPCYMLRKNNVSPKPCKGLANSCLTCLFVLKVRKCFQAPASSGLYLLLFPELCISQLLTARTKAQPLWCLQGHLQRGHVSPWCSWGLIGFHASRPLNRWSLRHIRSGSCYFWFRWWKCEGCTCMILKVKFMLSYFVLFPFLTFSDS